jgi:hypothetical protein
VLAAVGKQGEQGKQIGGAGRISGHGRTPYVFLISTVIITQTAKKVKGYTKKTYGHGKYGLVN